MCSFCVVIHLVILLLETKKNSHIFNIKMYGIVRSSSVIYCVNDIKLATGVHITSILRLTTIEFYSFIVVQLKPGFSYQLWVFKL